MVNCKDCINNYCAYMGMNDTKKCADFIKLEKAKPVAWLVEFENGEQELHFDEQSAGETHTPLYVTQRQWVGLTHEDMVKLQKDLYDAKGESVLPTTFAMAVEAKLKEKNT